MIHVVVPIMIAGALPFLLTLAAKSRGFSARDNHATRAWQAQLTGWRQRAHWAHLNAFETFPLFAAALMLAGQAGLGTVGVIAAWGYPALRVAFSAAFIADMARLRSLVWSVSMVCIVVLFGVALQA